MHGSIVTRLGVNSWEARRRHPALFEKQGKPGRATCHIYLTADLADAEDAQGDR
jgi:hypothetical protein